MGEKECEERKAVVTTTAIFDTYIEV